MKKMMKKLLSVLAFPLLLTGCAGETKSVRGYLQIGMEEAVSMMEKESDYIILDVRTPQEFAEKRIPGAINVPNESIGEEEIVELPHKDQLILVSCRSGRRSKLAAEQVVKAGFEVVELDGGILSWTGDKEP